MPKGRLFIISGPSGSGKDTIIAEVLKARPDIKVSVSCVTRDIREGETDGVDYSFISRDAFLNMIEKGELLEYNEYVGNFYGTPKAPVDSAINDGRDFILKIDVNGCASVKKLIPDVVCIFIMPPSVEILKKRLSRRGSETPEIFERRMKTAVNEMKCAVGYDYIVINDALDDAVKDVLDIINTDKLRTDRNIDFLNEVMENA